MYIVSKCLLGYDCKYDGGNNKNDDVIEFCKTHDYVTICPEIEGGLDCPRPPAEIVKEAGGGYRVINNEGTDVTRQFTEGAERSLKSVIKELAELGDAARIEGAILKANSPTCGSGTIYDGSFTHTKIEGNGLFTEVLLKAFEKEREEGSNYAIDCSFAENYTIVDENDVSKLANK